MERLGLAPGAWGGRALGGAPGVLEGSRPSLVVQQARQTEQIVLSLSEQYYLAQQDMQAGRFEHARQRFEYILAVDPGFPGAAAGLGQALAILKERLEQVRQVSHGKHNLIHAAALHLAH